MSEVPEDQLLNEADLLDLIYEQPSLPELTWEEALVPSNGIVGVWGVPCTDFHPAASGDGLTSECECDQYTSIDNPCDCNQGYTQFPNGACTDAITIVVEDANGTQIGLEDGGNLISLIPHCGTSCDYVQDEIIATVQQDCDGEYYINLTLAVLDPTAIDDEGNQDGSFTLSPVPHRKKLIYPQGVDIDTTNQGLKLKITHPEVDADPFQPVRF